jgi:tetratricopeptide (TPR) repeat protein
LVLGNLAKLYLETGRFPKADSVIREALAVGESTLGRDSAQAAYLHATAGRVQMGLADAKKAERELKEALRILETQRYDEMALPPVLAELATLYYIQHKWSASEAALLRSLDILERAKPLDERDLSRVLGRLAMVYYAQKAFDKAEPMFRRTITLRRKLFGPEDADSAMMAAALADILVSRGNYIEAEELFVKALQVQERALGPRTADVAGTLERFAGLLRKNNRLSLAKEMESRAASIRDELSLVISIKGNRVWQLR